MNVLYDEMQTLSRALKNSLLSTRAMRHRGVMGEIREGAVRAALRPYIPEQFSLSSGEVVNTAGEVSLQQDVILANTMTEAPFLAEGHLGVMPIEAVSAVLEVKSNAGGSDVSDGVEKVASVKRLLPDAKRTYIVADDRGLGEGQTDERPFGGIVCLAQKGTFEPAANAFTEANLSLPPALRTNALVVIDEHVMAWTRETPAQIQIEVFPAGGQQISRFAYKEDSLLLFYAILREGLRRYPRPHLDLIAYVMAAAPSADREVWTRPI